MRIKKGTPAVCPHCGELLDGPIEDWSIPGREGPLSRSEGDCGSCDGLFEVEQVSADEFEMTPLDGTYGED